MRREEPPPLLSVLPLEGVNNEERIQNGIFLTQQLTALVHKVSEFIQEAAPQLHLILLNVIPVPYMTAPTLGMHVAQAFPLSATLEQRYQAEETLHQARTELQQRGIAPTQIEELIRVGASAEEIVKAASE